MLVECVNFGSMLLLNCVVFLGDKGFYFYLVI